MFLPTMTAGGARELVRGKAKARFFPLRGAADPIPNTNPIPFSLKNFNLTRGHEGSRLSCAIR
jgi:hypothetical protein